MNKITVEITNCMDCKYSHCEKIRCSDSTGLYCGLLKDSQRRMSGHITEDKLIVADEGNLRPWADIPDWCPLLI